MAIKQACTQSRGYGVTMVADWMRENPNSDAFKKSHRRALRWLRVNKPDEPNPEALIEGLSTLFDARLTSAGTVTPESASRLTEHFAEFYYHALPFDPAALAAAWTSCRERTMSRDQCVLQIPRDEEKSLQLRADGDGAREAFIKTCMKKAFEGPRCQQGSLRAQSMLGGSF